MAWSVFGSRKKSDIPPRVFKRRLLLERLEHRLLFDAGPQAPVGPDPEVQDPSAGQTASAIDVQSVESADVRSTMPSVSTTSTEPAADSGQAPVPQTATSDAAMVLNPNESSATQTDSVGLPLDVNAVAEQLLTTSDDQNSEVHAANVDVRHELVFVDSTWAAANGLLQDLTANSGSGREWEVVVLDPTRDGIQQITDVLSQHSGLDAVHFLAQESNSGVLLGSTWLNLDSLLGHAGNVAQWEFALSSNAELQFHGGQFGTSSVGQNFLDSVAALTSANVVEASNIGAPSDTSAATAWREVVFIDSSVEDYQTLLANVDPLAEIVMLDSNRDGVEQILEVLSQHQGVSSVHIVSHGNSGELLLGNATLNFTSMQTQYAETLRLIGQSLSDNADILIYGCDFASGSYGQATASRLAEITGADVAASDDTTGNANLGGDWILEKSYGSIESDLAFGSQAQTSWRYVLAKLDWDTVNWTSGSLSQSYSVGGGTVSVALTGSTSRIVSGPVDDTTNTGGLSPVEESLLLDVNYTSQTTIGDQAITITIDFSHTGGVSNVSFSIFDIDSSGFTDQIIATASNGATINPSSVSVGSVVTFDGTNKVTGNANSDSDTANGNATFTFNQAGITQIKLVYQSGQLSNPSEQFISLHDISFNVRPAVDLDANNSSGAAGNNYTTTFTENGAAL